MGAFIDETGNTYGKLTVLCHVGKNRRGEYFWNCKCECGETHIVRGNSLRCGKIISCGCAREFSKTIDETGHVYGKLTVIRRVKKGSAVVWECKCDCGGVVYPYGAALRSGNAVSCGCLGGPKDEVGNIYGRLTVLKRAGKDKSRSLKWKCICDCGTVCIVRGSSLRNGTTKSCGCLRRDRFRNSRRTHGKSRTKEYAAAMTRNYREKKRRLDNEWSVEMELLLREMFPACVLCGMTEEEHLEKFSTSLHVDHVRPLSRGNGLKPGNATILCAKCNREKHNKPLRKLDKATQNTLLKTANEFKEAWISE